MFVEIIKSLNDCPHLLVIFLVLNNVHQHIFQDYFNILLLPAYYLMSPDGALSLLVLPWSCAITLQTQL